MKAELPDKLFQIAERLRGVQIECRSAVELIRREVLWMNFEPLRQETLFREAATDA